MIREAWESYESRVLPASAGAVQRHECRSAFYAGAYALFNGVMQNLSPGSEPNPTDLMMMNELHEELREYARSLSR